MCSKEMSEDSIKWFKNVQKKQKERGVSLTNACFGGFARSPSSEAPGDGLAAATRRLCDEELGAVAAGRRENEWRMVRGKK